MHQGIADDCCIVQNTVARRKGVLDAIEDKEVRIVVAVEEVQVQVHRQEACGQGIQLECSRETAFSTVQGVMLEFISGTYH